MTTTGGKVIPVHTVTINKHAPVLEVDVGSAWKAMGLEAGWSNEVGVEIFLNV